MAKSWTVILLVALFCLSLVQEEALARNRQRAQRGRRRLARQNPTADSQYIVSIQYRGYHVCAGTLVSRRHVLTAATCLYKPQLLSVVAGSRNRQSGLKRNVAGQIRHPQFNNITLSNNIGLLTLSKPLQGRKVRPIRLCNYRVQAGNRCKIAGWGQSGQNAELLNQLSSATMPVIGTNQCRNSYKGVIKVTQQMLCASRNGGTTINGCVGDLGGPLVCRNQVCGVVVNGGGCAQEKYPGLFSSVYAYRSFIRKNIR